MKIIVLDGHTLNPGDLSWSAFEAFGQVTVYDRTPQSEIIRRIGDAEIIITNKTPISLAVLEACPSVKYIGVLATGYNVVDVAAAKASGVVVTNIPTYGTDAVAQYAIALLLELCHHIGAHSDAVKRGDWERSIDWCFWNYPLMELSGKTMGIIGFGRIGQKTAQIAQAFGMKVLAYDHHENPAFITETCRFASMAELLAQADVISLHCPLTEETAGLINQETISQMKNGVLIVNTSRGPLINEQDLADALNTGKVGGAASDVVSVEPIRSDNPLLIAKNMIITPHIAWAPLESRQRLMAIAVGNVEAYLAGSPVNVVG